MEGNKILEVYVIKTGEAEVPGPEVYWMEGWGEWEKLSFHALLVKGKDFNFLINTGLPDDLTERNKAMYEFAGEKCFFKSFDIVKELKKLNIETSEITGLSFTPLQDYTTGGISKFRNAQIYLYRQGWCEDIVAPKYKHHLSRNLYIPEKELKYLMFEAWERVVFFDCSPYVDLLPGIRVYWVGCHHRSSLAFQIFTRSGPVIFSDCSFKQRNIEKRVPIGIAENTLECLDAYSFFSGKGIFLSAYDPEIDNLEF